MVVVGYSILTDGAVYKLDGPTTQDDQLYGFMCSNPLKAP